MRFLCRLGIHKWGSWSKPWHIKYIGAYDVASFKVMRSLRCKSCKEEKHVCKKIYSNLGRPTVNDPVWED